MGEMYSKEFEVWKIKKNGYWEKVYEMKTEMTSEMIYFSP